MSKIHPPKESNVNQNLMNKVADERHNSHMQVVTLEEENARFRAALDEIAGTNWHPAKVAWIIADRVLDPESYPVNS